MRYQHPNPDFKSIPILNPGLELKSTSLPNNENPVAVTRFQNGTKEIYHFKDNKITVVYTDGRTVIDHADGAVATNKPGQLTKLEYPMKRLENGRLQINTVYKKFRKRGNKIIKETFFIVNNFLNDHLSIVDKRKNKVTHFHKNGAIEVYKDKKPKKIDLDANISRRALPDGTQIKKLSC